MNCRILSTADGSNTVFHPAFNENYHSVYGAITESQHVFIDAGLRQLMQNAQAIRILEIGLGTGLNALLSYAFADAHHLTIHYTALEPFPLDTGLIQSLNYAQFLGVEKYKPIFNAIHSAPFESETAVAPGFDLLKRHVTLEAFATSPQYNLVYFDAFGPQVQPGIWSLSNFEKLFHLLLPHGLLVTYCAKGAVRRTMQQAGFRVERLPGPPGKREMLRAMRIAT